MSEAVWMDEGDSSSSTQNKTVLVLGIAKSGTTMLAGVARLLGVSFGSAASLGEWNNHHEDISFIEAMTNDWSLFQKMLRERNLKNNVWGLKHPSLDHLLVGRKRNYLYEFRHPHVLAIVRDPRAIFENRFRDQYQMMENRDILVNMRKIAQETDHLHLRLVQMIGVPILMVSYEKALDNNSQLVMDVTNFLELNPTIEETETAVNYVRPNAGYMSINSFINR